LRKEAKKVGEKSPGQQGRKVRKITKGKRNPGWKTLDKRVKKEDQFRGTYKSLDKNKY